MQEGGLIEHAAVAHDECNPLFPACLGHGPGIEHAMGGQHIGPAVFASDVGSRLGKGVPDGVDVNDVISRQPILHLASCVASQEQLQTAWHIEHVMCDEVETGNCRQGLDLAIVAGGGRIRQDMDGVPERCLRGGQMSRNGGWAAEDGIQ